MKLTKITAAEIKTNEAGNYNISTWKQIVSRYEKYNADFYIADQKAYGSDSFYAVYVVEGMRFIKEITFCSSLTSAPLQMVIIAPDGYVEETKTFYPKTEQGRSLARRMTELASRVAFR